jgi:glutathione synthase/RimK-type ligase-like ATP-grasp enzyme
MLSFIYIFEMRGCLQMREFGTAKWHRYNLMKESEVLASHLPKTQQLSKRNFLKFINQYGEVIVKPDDGRRGRGVFKVSPKGNGKYEVHIEDQKKMIRGIHETYDYVAKQIGSEAYIIQRRIPLAQIDGRIIDFRIIVQRRTANDPWKVTAKVVKVAGKGYIVTNNARSKGTILHVGEAIERSTLKDVSKKKLVSKIERIALRASKRLTRYFKKQRIYGFDIGVDNNGYIWIIEANLDPMLSHFRKLKDKTFYYRILDYKRG